MTIIVPAPRAAEGTFCGLTDIKYPPVGDVGCE